MTLYHFHIRNEVGLVEDEDGFNLPDVSHVRDEALRTAREFFADGGSARDGLEFEVTDDTGHVVLRMPIQDPYKQRSASSALAMDGTPASDPAQAPSK